MNIFDIFIVQPIFNLLVLIYSIIPGADFGIALIVFTIIIRLLMWPLVKKQIKQAGIMRKIQPEVKRIKVKAKGNRQAEAMMTMDLYRKHGIKPFRSILILLIQLPIFFALFRVIQIFTQSRHEIVKYTYDFLENIPIINSIIKDPSSFNEELLGFINLTERAVSPEGINFVLIALAVLAAVTQYILSKQTMPHEPSKKRMRDILAEAGDGKQPDQAEMNAVMMGKMMKFLPVMMFFIMINLPAALALYYAVSNIVAVLQQHYMLKKDGSQNLRTTQAKNTTETTTKSSTKGKKTASQRAKTAKTAKVSETKITRIKAKDK